MVQWIVKMLMKVAGGKVKGWQGEVKFGFHTFPLGSLSFFIWQAMHKKIATEYKVREIAGIIPSCRGLCMSSDEDVDHIFLHCPFAVSFLGENFLQLWTSFWYQKQAHKFSLFGLQLFQKWSGFWEQTKLVYSNSLICGRRVSWKLASGWA